MGAIVAVYRLDGRPVHSQELDAMMDRMPHRAIHGRGAHVIGSVGLGHGSIRILPEAQPDESPLSVADGAVVVTADARLDNRDDLLRILSFRRPPEELSDERILAEAYLKWGPSFPEHLLGAFTYCIWDARSNALHCGRDQLGLRPLYYVHMRGRLFACATEIKALLTLQDVKPRMSEIMAAFYIESLKEEPQKTIFDGILRLPAGMNAQVASGDFSLKRYWELELPPTASGSDATFVEEFRHHFDEAVRARIRSSGPVGSQLSGGLDSSYVTSRAARLLSDELSPLRTYSILFPEDPEADESEYIRLLTRDPELHSRFLSVEDKGPLDYLDWIYDVLDDGVVGGNYITQICLLQAAAEDGVSVLLDGFDGDTTVEHGYPRFKTLAEEGAWTNFYGLAQITGARLEPSQVEETAFVGRRFKQYAFNRYARPQIQNLVGGRRYYGAARALIASRMERAVSVSDSLALLRGKSATEAPQQTVQISFLKEDVVNDLGLRERLSGYSTAHGNDSMHMRERQRRLHISGKRARVSEISNHLAASLHMDLRHPFMDLRLIKYCLSLPEEQSLNNGWTRYVMRNAMVGHVPDEVTWRPDKAGMGDVFRRGLLSRNKAYLEELLRSPGVMRDYVDERQIEKWLKSPETAQQSDLVKLTSLAITLYWLNRSFGADR